MPDRRRIDPLDRLQADLATRRGSRREFREQLEACTGTLVDLAATVGDAVQPLTAAFVEADQAVVADYEGMHEHVRNTCANLEEACYLLLARQGPVGGDLRRIVATVRCVSDVHRASSLLRHIGGALTWVHPPSLSHDLRHVLHELGQQVGAVYTGAVDAWRKEDALAVVTLQALDDEVDFLHRVLLTELYLGPQSTEESVSLALVARYYERLADHGVELARQLAYAVTGLRASRPGPRLAASNPSAAGRYAGRAKESPMSETPTVLFLCVHNAGRSQMAAGWLRHLAGDDVTVLSGGSAPAAEVNPAAIEAMAEAGVDITGREPKRWTDADLDVADVVVTMGCGDECPYIPGKRYLDWELDDPSGQPLEEVRRIRDDIERRVRDLMAELGVNPL